MRFLKNGGYNYFVALFPSFYLFLNNYDEINFDLSNEIFLIFLIPIIFVFLILRILNFLKIHYEKKKLIVSLIVVLIFIKYTTLIFVILSTILCVIFFKKIFIDYKIINSFISIAIIFIWIFSSINFTYNYINLLTQGEGNSGFKKISCSNLKDKDIFFIILDGYSNSKSMFRYWSFDNFEFEKKLEDRNFKILKDSKSNFNFTEFSIFSTLNFKISKDLNMNDPYSKENINKIVIGTKNNRLKKILNSCNYDFDFAYARWSKKWVSYSDRPKNYKVGDFQKGEFIGTFLNKTVFQNLSKKFQRQYTNKSAYNEVIYQLNFVDEYINKRKKRKNVKPRFILLHINVPHPPYVFKENGEFNETNSNGSNWDYIDEYKNSIKFINNEILKIIDNAQSKYRNKPIIILQGDHGFSETKNETNLLEKISLGNGILNAMYLPESNFEKIYNDATSVNTFPILFNSYMKDFIKFEEDLIYHLLVNEKKFHSKVYFPSDFY